MTTAEHKIKINSVFLPDYMAPYFAERKRAKVRKPEAFLELVKMGIAHIQERKPKWDTLAAMMCDLTFHNVGTEVTLDNVFDDTKPTAQDLSWKELRDLMAQINAWLEDSERTERIPYLLTFMVNLARLGYEVHMMK